MAEEKFLIHELADRAKTTVRTIRYYTDEGLLPQPETQGKYAYYTRAHLERLELIRRIKDTYLPLREIREILNALSDEEVHQRLAEKPHGAIEDERGSYPAGASPKPGANALDYIAHLMDKQAGHRSEGTPPSPQPSPRGVKSTPSVTPAPLPGPGGVPAAATAAPPGESWQRIPLAPGVELHLRQPPDPADADPAAAVRIQKLIAWAQQLFSHA